VDQREAPEEQPGEGDEAVAAPDPAHDDPDVADWETNEQPLVPVRFSANGWPVAVGRAAVPSPERLIELELEPAPPPERREPQPQPSSVRTPLAAALVVVSGLMLAGICGFALLLPADADVGPGPPSLRNPDQVLVLPAPHAPTGTPSPTGVRTAPAAGGGAPGNGVPLAGGGYVPGNGGGNPGGRITTGTGNGGVPVNQPMPGTTVPSAKPSTGAGRPSSAPSTSVPEAQPTTQPPTQAPPSEPAPSEPAPVDTKTTEPSPAASPNAPAVAESPDPSATGSG
jgi:hypothetical protein